MDWIVGIEPIDIEPIELASLLAVSLEALLELVLFIIIYWK